MAGCDGWITIKIFELIFATFCMIYKRVTDDEANKLFYFLQKFSREWPLLNNITWEENGAIFTDITYGGYIIIIIGLIVGQCTGELQKCRKMENFFLILGALLFIAAGSLELAALESVEERLVDNAAILGVFSLLTGFLFIIDLLCAGKRRKKEQRKIIEKYMQSRPTQTEESKSSELIKAGYLNGNIQNGKVHSTTDLLNGSKIPRNGVKLLPFSPMVSDSTLTPVPNVNEYTGPIMYSAEPPVFDRSEIKTHEGRIKSTESFLRSEKGYYSKYQQSNSNFFIPAGYVLLPAEQHQGKAKPKSDSGMGDSPTPPGYAKIIPDAKGKPSYIVIPIDQNGDDRDLLNTAVDSPEFYLVESQGKKIRSPNLRKSASFMNSSDISDAEDSKYGNEKRETKTQPYQRIPSRYFENDSRGRKYIMPSEDSSDEQKMSYQNDQFRPESRLSSKSFRSSNEWNVSSKGNINEAFANEKESELTFISRKSSPHRSRSSSPEKPKSILRYDYGRSSKKDSGLKFLKGERYDSLDSQKIAEDLRNLKEITKSDLILTENLEKQNKILKERLKMEKKEKEKLKNELEDRKKLEEAEEEKNRRISEREEQYFGIKDIKQSHKDGLEAKLESCGAKENLKDKKGAKDINENLKQKYLEHESKAAREAQEFRDLIDERFHFLHEEEKGKKLKETAASGKSGISEFHSTPDPSTHSMPLKFQRSDSDEINSSQSTDEEIRLRVGTPGSASFKSEALFWLGENQKSNTPTSPGSPGYVLYTAQNWPEASSPEDRFQFSSKEAQQLRLGTPPKTPELERVKSDFSGVDGKKSSQKQRLLEFEEVPESAERPLSGRKGLLVRKVDFPKEPVVEVKKPAIVQGSTSTWRRWLYPKPKLQHTRSVPD